MLSHFRWLPAPCYGWPMRNVTLLGLGLSVVASLVVACGDDGGSGGAGGEGGDTSGQTSTTKSGATSQTSTGQTSTSQGATTDAATTGSGMDEAQVNLTFTGCAPSFTGDLVVVSNQESVAISTTTGTISSLQLDLHQTSGSIEVSTAQRVATGDVINLVTMNSTWTNISSQMPDPIAGTLTINSFDEQGGVMDLVFDQVVLENVQGLGLCTVDGTVTSTGTSF